jgi:type III restriction enzyme
MFLRDGSDLTVDPVTAIDFSQRLYEPAWFYEGSFKFKKHYYPPGPGELQASGEEYHCAVFLDGLPEVKFWVRNIARRPGSFALQISTGVFYPDFVCQLQDGRVLVVEYKGRPWYEIEQSEEKRTIGRVWEGRSNGRCLFVMPNGPDLEAVRRKITQSFY